MIRLRDKSSSGGGGGGAYARDKNTSARLCAKNAGGAYARGGAYLRDTTVLKATVTTCRNVGVKCLVNTSRTALCIRV